MKAPARFGDRRAGMPARPVRAGAARGASDDGVGGPIPPPIRVGASNGAVAGAAPSRSVRGRLR